MTIPHQVLLWRVVSFAIMCCPDVLEDDGLRRRREVADVATRIAADHGRRRYVNLLLSTKKYRLNNFISGSQPFFVADIGRTSLLLYRQTELLQPILPSIIFLVFTIKLGHSIEESNFEYVKNTL